MFCWIMAVMLKWKRSEVSFAGWDFWGHWPFPFHKCDALIRFHWILSFQNAGWENSLCFEWISFDNIINSVLRAAFWNWCQPLGLFTYSVMSASRYDAAVHVCFWYSCVCVPFDLISGLLPLASAEIDWYSRRMNMYAICTLTWTWFWPLFP